MTLYDFIKKGGITSVGRPTLLSAGDEKAIAELLDTVAERKLVLRLVEVRLVAKDLLDWKGEVFCCQDNIPGDDWFVGFMKRNKMFMRYASHINDQIEDRPSRYNYIFQWIRKNVTAGWYCRINSRKWLKLWWDKFRLVFLWVFGNTYHK